MPTAATGCRVSQLASLGCCRGPPCHSPLWDFKVLYYYQYIRTWYNTLLTHLGQEREKTRSKTNPEYTTPGTRSSSSSSSPGYWPGMDGVIDACHDNNSGSRLLCQNGFFLKKHLDWGPTTQPLYPWNIPISKPGTQCFTILVDGIRRLWDCWSIWVFTFSKILRSTSK